MKYLTLFIPLIFIACCDTTEDSLMQWDIKVDQELSYENKIPGRVIITHGEKVIDDSMRIKLRGDYSKQFEKKSYSINLNNDVVLDSLEADDDFILNANYIDKTFFRHVLSYDLYDRIVNASHQLSPQSFFSEVYVNGEYQGLYAVHTRVDKGYVNLQKRTEGSFLFKAPAIFNQPRVSASSLTSSSQEYPSLKFKNYLPFMKSLRKELLLHQGCNLEVAKKYFDLNELASWQIMLELSNNDKGLYENFYIFRRSNKDKLHICIWDYDHTYGREGNNNLDEKRDILSKESNILLHGLNECPEFQQLLKERWNNLRSNGLVSIEWIDNKIKDHIAQLEPYILRNQEKWPYDSKDYTDGNGLHDEIIIMREFFLNQIPILDHHYGYKSN